jgi:transposase-like protein
VACLKRSGSSVFSLSNLAAEGCLLATATAPPTPGSSRDFDLTETAVRLWVSQAQVEDGEKDGLVSAERDELARLRRENRRLRTEGISQVHAGSRGAYGSARSPASYESALAA